MPILRSFRRYSTALIQIAKHQASNSGGRRWEKRGLTVRANHLSTHSFASNELYQQQVPGERRFPCQDCSL